MLTLRDDPFAGLGRLRGDMERWFGSPESTLRQARPRPALNAWELDDALVVEAELPGHTMETLDIVLTGRDLTIRARREQHEPEGATVHRRERVAGEVARTVRLPFDVEPDGVEANLRDGVLTLRMPRAKADMPRKIQVVSE